MFQYLLFLKGCISFLLVCDFAKVLIHHARQLYIDDDFGLQLQETVYALDATIIDLCLSVFPWARFRKSKGAIKPHAFLDLRGSIPSFVAITHGKVHEVNILDELIPEAGSIYIMDRAYLGFERLYTLHQNSASFIVREKSNACLRRLYSMPVDKSSGIQCDQVVVPTGFYSQQHYPDKIRPIKYFDKEQKKEINVSYKSVYFTGYNHSGSLSMPVASRIIL